MILRRESPGYSVRTFTMVHVKSHSDPTKSDLVSATYVIPRNKEFRGAFVGENVMLVFLVP